MVIGVQLHKAVRSLDYETNKYRKGVPIALAFCTTVILVSNDMVGVSVIGTSEIRLFDVIYRIILSVSLAGTVVLQI